MHVIIHVLSRLNYSDSKQSKEYFDFFEDSWNQNGGKTLPIWDAYYVIWRKLDGNFTEFLIFPKN